MAKISVSDAVRIIPRDAEFLNRKSGLRGEVFYDQTANTLRIYNGSSTGGLNLARGDLANVSTSDFRSKSVVSKLATVTYQVTITGPQGGDTGNKYNLNGVYRPILNFVVGYTYVFVQDDPTNVYFPNVNGTTVNQHPLNFSADNLSGNNGGGTSYLVDVQYYLDNVNVTQAVYNSNMFATATARQVRITVTNSTPALLYYWCWNHLAMGQSIAVADPGSGTGSGGALNDLSDVVLTTPTINQVLKYNGTNWINDTDLESNSFATIAVAGQSSVAAGTPTDTLTLVAGAGITLTTNAGTDAITITSTASTGNITFVANTIDSTDSTAITVTPAVNFESDVVVGNEIVFADGTRQNTSAVGVPGPVGPQGPAGASGAGTGDVLSSGGGYVDNAIVRYDGTTGTIIQTSSATISDAGLLTATNFSGGGSALTSLNATQLTSGTIPDARFPATLPAVSGANLTALPATLPAASGANLTALNATQLTSGTVPIGRLGSSGTPSASTYLRGDNTWATVSGGGLASDSFATISVAGQSNVVADSATDTLTLVAGTGITITTDAGTDTVTITNSGTGQNTFETIAVAGQSSVVADSATDTLTIAAGTGISITTDAGTDTVTITSTVSAGATSFTGLSDRADLTIDQFYLQAITRLNVTNNGASAYRFDQYGTTDDPTVYAINGTTIAFNLNVTGHPFLIQDGAGANYNTGLVHVTTGGTVTTGASAQGQTSGTLYWKIPDSITGSYRYQCSVHAAMIGTIQIKNFASI
jgi:plastocyanin